jgi:hypothetical protein
MNTNNAPDRVIHVSLSEEEWLAFTSTQPQPVKWLKERIQEAIETARRQDAPERKMN